MNPETIAPSKKYKMVTALSDKIDLLTKNEKNYVLSIINDFNFLIKNNKNVIKDPYISKLILDDWFLKVDKIDIDINVRTYLKNYICARVKNDLPWYKQQQL